MGVLRDELVLTPKGFETEESRVAKHEASEAKLFALWRILRDTGCGIMTNILYDWLN